jgi:hypothetical protein
VTALDPFLPENVAISFYTLRHRISDVRARPSTSTEARREQFANAATKLATMSITNPMKNSQFLIQSMPFLIK